MKILSILNLGKEELKANQAQRKAKALARNQERLIDELEDKKDSLIEQKQNLESVTMDTNVDSWNRQYQDCIVELAMLDAQIKMAHATMTEFFTESK